jgi:hypothetical protein
VPFELIDLSEKQRARLKDFFLREHAMAMQGRQEMAARWKEWNRQYEAFSLFCSCDVKMPRTMQPHSGPVFCENCTRPVKEFPWVGASSIEIPLAKIHVNSIYARVMQAILAAPDVFVVHPVSGKWADHAGAAERWLRYAASNDLNLTQVISNWVLKIVKYGTGILAIPYDTVRRKVSRDRLVERSFPRFVSAPLESFVVPGGFYDVQELPWFAMHRYFMPNQLALREKRGELYRGSTELIMPALQLQMGEVETQRTEELGLMLSTERVETILSWMFFDIDGDLVDEDIIVEWIASNGTPTEVIAAYFNPYDHLKRNLVVSRYFPRDYMFYGIGVINDLSDLQAEISATHRHRMDNMTAANTRLWKALRGAIEEDFKIWPNRVVELDNLDDLRPEQLGEIYPSSTHAETMTLGYAERISGIADPQLGRPSQTLGTRAPATSVLTMLQEGNRRFALAIDDIRASLNEAGTQAMQLYHQFFHEHRERMRRVLSERDFQLMTELFSVSTEEMQDRISVEIRASSATVNKEVDAARDLQAFEFLSRFYERVFQLSAVLSNQQLPAEIRSMADNALSAASVLAKRILQSLNQRDADRLLPEDRDESTTATGARAPGQIGDAELAEFLASVGESGAGPMGASSSEQ